MRLDLYNRFFAPLLTKVLLKNAEKSAEYYLNNATSIENTEQIPSGNRACRMFIFQCQSCGFKKVSIVDFLKVRDYEIVKSGDIYPYEKFRNFFNNI